MSAAASATVTSSMMDWEAPDELSKGHGLPPEKWSSLKYGFISLKEDENGRQETDI